MGIFYLSRWWNVRKWRWSAHITQRCLLLFYRLSHLCSILFFFANIKLYFSYCLITLITQYETNMFFISGRSPVKNNDFTAIIWLKHIQKQPVDELQKWHLEQWASLWVSQWEHVKDCVSWRHTTLLSTQLWKPPPHFPLSHRSLAQSKMPCI